MCVNCSFSLENFRIFCSTLLFLKSHSCHGLSSPGDRRESDKTDSHFHFYFHPILPIYSLQFLSSKDFLLHHLLFFSPSPSSFSSFFLSSSSFPSTLEILSLLFLQICLPLHFFFLSGTFIIWMLALWLYFSICLGFSFHIFCLSFPSSLREDYLSLAFYIINVSPPHGSCLLFI